jgi:hypothetical protein
MVSYFSFIGIKIFVTAEADPIFPGNAGIFFRGFNVNDPIKIADLVLDVPHPFLHALFIYLPIYDMLHS